MLVLINFIVQSCGCKGRRSRGRPGDGCLWVGVKVGMIIFPILAQAIICGIDLLLHMLKYNLGAVLILCRLTAMLIFNEWNESEKSCDVNYVFKLRFSLNSIVGVLLLFYFFFPRCG